MNEDLWKLFTNSFLSGAFAGMLVLTTQVPAKSGRAWEWWVIGLLILSALGFFLLANWRYKSIWARWVRTLDERDGRR